MARRHEVTNAQQLRTEVDGAFSVNGLKSRLLSIGNSQAIFITMRDGSYKEGTSVAIDIDDIDNGNTSVYKLGSWKDKEKNPK